MVASFSPEVIRVPTGKREQTLATVALPGMSIVLAPTGPESSKSSVFSGRPGRPHGARRAEPELGIPDKQQEVKASSVFFLSLLMIFSKDEFPSFNARLCLSNTTAAFTDLHKGRDGTKGGSENPSD